MTKKLLIAESGQLNPYINLAFEEYLLNNLAEDTFILYLWRNDNTVVIGLNQNAYRECNVKALLSDGGYVARRKTGGGAVYHDKHNLNFTFIGRKSDYDVGRQLDIILNGINKLGIKAVKSGRNDLTTEDGRKFSGNAFLEKDGKALHHGTILIDTDTDKIMKYLTVNPVKLIAKGVKSVVSRVVNLKSINPDITVDKVKKAFTETATEIFNPKEVIYTTLEENITNLNKLLSEYSNERFIFGNRAEYSSALDKRFGWGTASVGFTVLNGLIKDINLSTDSLDTSVKDRVETALKGSTIDCDITHNPEAQDILELIRYGG